MGGQDNGLSPPVHSYTRYFSSRVLLTATYRAKPHWHNHCFHTLDIKWKSFGNCLWNGQGRQGVSTSLSYWSTKTEWSRLHIFTLNAIYLSTCRCGAGNPPTTQRSTLWSTFDTHGVNFHRTAILLRVLCSCWLKHCLCRYWGMQEEGASISPQHVTPEYQRSVSPPKNAGELPRGDVKGSIQPGARSRSAYGIHGVHRQRRQNFPGIPCDAPWCTENFC